MKTLLANKVSQMNADEVLAAIYTDTLTGIWNRRAFEETPESAFIAIVDLDSLKWVNDEHGHRAGDILLRSVAVTLRKMFGDDAFRLSGDEFVIRADSAEILNNKLGLLKDRIFSFGVGRTLPEADISLTLDKNNREADGTRAGRGEEAAFNTQELLTLGSFAG